MSFLARLRADREPLAITLEKHKGIRRLIEDFYPDNAHFIYELLQNSEDAGATEVKFELLSDKLVFEHNGRRSFTEKDVESITDIGESSKQADTEAIGKFGVGFKSVFVYTESPVVYSKTFSFRITRLVLPEAVAPFPNLDGRTRFEFPFNSSKKSPAVAHAEVQEGLRQLADTTLLFLTNLRCISWSFSGQTGEVLRERHSEVHIEILKAAPDGKSSSSHWLRFDRPVEGLERQTVAVAYELAFVGERNAFESGTALAKQMKIVPAERGRVAVFFPADKEESGLRFHLHAPFIPELSRASIKDSPVNEPLFRQLGHLAASSLHWLKAEGLLTGEFLAVLPSSEDPVRKNYQVVRQAIIKEMQEQALTPTHSRQHAPANRLLQARAVLKDLLSDADLAFLHGSNVGLTWSISPNQRGSKQEKFLSSLDIRDWDADEFIEHVAHAATPGNSWSYGGADPRFMNWLRSKPDEWHQQFYAVMYRALIDEDDFKLLEEAQIVRKADGSYCILALAGVPLLQE